LLIVFEAFNFFILSTFIIVLDGLFSKNNYYTRLEEKVKISEGIRIAYISILILIGVAVIVVCVLTGELLFFHLFLFCKNMTTYDFILARSKRRNKYKVSQVIAINEKQAVEEVPMEEIFEPYIENPQFEGNLSEEKKMNIARIVPESLIIPQSNDSKINE
jgi:hypothetical protein